jgi:hemoglobin/transferrin/lactoferrin receptor protein
VTAPVYFFIQGILNMKQLYMLCGALLFTIVIHGQTVTVQDMSTLRPIANAEISNADHTVHIMTDQEGVADVSTLQGTSSVSITLPGYQTIETTYDELVQQNATIFLQESAHQFDAVVVSASRFEESVRNVAQPVEVIRATDLAFQNMQTTADVMQYTGNVFVQKSQLGGGSPVIRGFETNKVLLVVDGIRMNNAIYRGGHLQNIVTLDNAAMDKVEILYGPGSVMYGSDALGGVMNFFTKSPTLSGNDQLATHVNAFARYSTANQEKTAHADISLGGKKFGSLTSFTFSDFDDLLQGKNRSDEYPDFGKRPYYQEHINGEDVQTPNEDVNLQVASGYTQYDFLQKFTFQQNEKVSHQVNLQYSTSTDVPRYDRLTETTNGAFDGPLRFGEWYYGPQERLLGAYSLKLNNDHGIYDQAHITAGYQFIEESRHDRRFGNPSINHRTEQLDIFTLNADFSKMTGKSTWRFGLEGTTNHVDSKAIKENINTGDEAPQSTRYPDGGSDVTTGALYLSDQYQLAQKITLNGGLRLSYNSLKASFVDTTFYPFPFTEVTQQYTNLSGSLGAVWNGNKGWRVSALAATGFRAPNVDDLAKVFESVPGSVVVPNPDLGPEKTFNLDLGISKTINDKHTVGIDGFYTWYNDAITLQPGTFNGQSQIEYDGELSDVKMSVNAVSAYLYGFNAYVNVQLTKGLSLYSTINYTYGRIDTDTTDYPLDHIPPVFGKTSLDYKIKKFRAEVYAMYNGWKKLEDYNLNGEDNYPFATVDGMPSWATFNLKASYQLTQHFTVQVGLENILDHNYRAFASNISAPGRNLSVTIRGSF